MEALTDDAIFDLFQHRCASCLVKQAVCIHHLYGRGSEERMPLCHSCHVWATDHTREARMFLPRRMNFALRIFADSCDEAAHAAAISVTPATSQVEDEEQGPRA